MTDTKHISLTVDTLYDFARFIFDAERVLAKVTHGRHSEQFHDELRRLIGGWAEQQSLLAGSQ
jgi:hypothetical protein